MKDTVTHTDIFFGNLSVACQKNTATNRVANYYHRNNTNNY